MFEGPFGPRRHRICDQFARIAAMIGLSRPGEGQHIPAEPVPGGTGSQALLETTASLVDSASLRGRSLDLCWGMLWSLLLQNANHVSELQGFDNLWVEKFWHHSSSIVDCSSICLHQMMWTSGTSPSCFKTIMRDGSFRCE